MTLVKVTKRPCIMAAPRNSDETYYVLYEASRNAILMRPPERAFTAANPAIDPASSGPVARSITFH